MQKEVRDTIIMILLLFLVQVVSVYLAMPMTAAQTAGIAEPAFGDPESISSPFLLLAMMLIATVIFLIILKFKMLHKLLKAFFLFTVWVTVFLTVSLVNGDYPNGIQPITWVIPTIATITIWLYPEWFIVDIVCFVMAAGSSAVIGTNFGIVPLSILLVILAVYDAVAVYKTKHMLTLAEGALSLRLPIMYIIPENPMYSYRKSVEWKNLDNVKGRQATIIGLGDIIFPTTLVVSASAFLPDSHLLIGAFTLPVIGAMIGSYVGMGALKWFAYKHPQSHAGLPFLNAFTIIGFVCAYALSIWVGV